MFLHVHAVPIILPRYALLLFRFMKRSTLHEGCGGIAGLVGNVELAFLFSPLAGSCISKLTGESWTADVFVRASVSTSACSISESTRSSKFMRKQNAISSRPNSISLTPPTFENRACGQLRSSSAFIATRKPARRSRCTFRGVTGMTWSETAMRVM